MRHTGLKSLTLSVPLQRSLLSLIASGISILCVHTAADNALGGTNDLLGSALLRAAGLDATPTVGPQMKAIKESAVECEGHKGAGSGRLVDLGEGISKEKVVAAVKELLGVEHRESARCPCLSRSAPEAWTLTAARRAMQYKRRGPRWARTRSRRSPSAPGAARVS